MGIGVAFNTNVWGGALPRQGICPAGWHVPSDAEWGTLVSTVEASALVGSGGGGTALKSADFSGTDRFGFGVLASGLRAAGTFSGLGSETYFWTATEYFDLNIWYRGFTASRSSVVSFYDYLGSKTNGLPVRCIAD